MITIESEKTSEIVVKKSKFIANIFRVNTIEEAEKKINEISKKYHDARHNCYAYVIDAIEKCSDDGEPSKTAGAPILDIIKKRKLQNVVIIVTRYFGGILLGTGGLVRAYSEAAQNVIDLAGKIEVTKGIRYKIKINYENQKNVMYWCKKNNINIIEMIYENNIILTLESTIEDKEKLISNIKIIEEHIISEENVFVKKYRNIKNDVKK